MKTTNRFKWSKNDLSFVDATVSKSLIDLLKASFGGDRSAAGRYAAEQRWKGNQKKDKPKGKKRVSAVERTKEQKMSDGPILVGGRDKFGFPKLLSVADGEKKFGKTIKEIKDYFKKRGLTINLEPETKILVQPPELYAALQGVDDVLNAIKTESKEGFTVVAGTNQPLPEVTIQYIEENPEGAVGGDFTQMGENSWKVPNINIYAGMMTVYGKLIGESPGTTIPQLSASNRERLSKTGEFSQAVTYGFAVHEFGHFVDYAMRRGGVMSFWSRDMKNALRMREAVGENSRMRNEILEGLSDDFKTKGKLFSEIGGRIPAGLENEPGMKYSSTNILEKFAETFTSWFLLSQAKSVWVDRAKENLKTRGGDFVTEKITDVVKQAIIKDNLREFPPDHPIFLFAFGRMQDTDATVSKSLIELLKASFGGDRSAAGRYAAEQRWKGNRKKDEPKGVKSLKSAIVDALPMAMKLKSKPWGAGDESHYEMMVEMGHSEKSAKLATSETITLGDYGDPAVAAGNCGIASVDVAVFLMIAGVAKEGEVFLREVGEPSYGDQGGTHFVTHIGPRDSEDAIIVDFTLRQFEPKADFPWVGTVKEYRETGYETDEVMGPEMGEEMDLIDAQGQVAYPWLDPNFAGDTDSK